MLWLVDTRSCQRYKPHPMAKTFADKIAVMPTAPRVPRPADEAATQAPSRATAEPVMAKIVHVRLSGNWQGTVVLQRCEHGMWNDHGGSWKSNTDATVEFANEVMHRLAVNVTSGAIDARLTKVS